VTDDNHKLYNLLPPRNETVNMTLKSSHRFNVAFQTNRFKKRAAYWLLCEETTRKAAKNLYCLRECRRANLPVEVGLATYLTKIRPILEYCSPVWGGVPRYLKDELERVQRRSLQIIGLPHGYLPTLEERRIEATSRELDTILGDPSHIFLPKKLVQKIIKESAN
jgi:hypothetical protein